MRKKYDLRFFLTKKQLLVNSFLEFLLGLIDEVFAASIRIYESPANFGLL